MSMINSPLVPLAIFGSALKCGGDMFDMMNGRCGSAPPAPPPAPPATAPPAPVRDHLQTSTPTTKPSAAPMQSLFHDDKPIDIRPEAARMSAGGKANQRPANPLGPIY